MIVERLELLDYRNYRSATFDLEPGITVVVGNNGQGKTNFAEAVAYLATLSSFRQVGTEALVRTGATQAIVRANVRADDGRISLVEVELTSTGRGRAQVNRQRLSRTRDLLGVLRVTLFSPDDLALIKGGPAERRGFLDDALVALAVKYDALRLELDRTLRQRNTLLRQLGGRLDESAATTLDVWDARMAESGEQLGRARATLIERAGPYVTAAYAKLAGGHEAVTLDYSPVWRTVGLAAALAAARDDDVRRGVTTVGPHRDELTLAIDGMPARTHASQGEQRTLALALRLGVHDLIVERTGTQPVLVLDDVLSELDADRATALLQLLPDAQVVITTAGPVPLAADRQRVIRINAGEIVAEKIPET
jgi:DNA replication and repair protein RecF